MNITYRNKVVQNGLKCILVLAFIFLLGNKCFSGDFSIFESIDNEMTSNIMTPQRQVNNVLDLVNSKNQGQITNTVKAEMAFRNFKWAFKAEGISFIKPAVDSNSGALYVPTTDVDISVNVRDLSELDEDAINIGNLQGKLYCLSPNSILNRGRKNWEVDTNGITIFSPEVSGNGDVFVESVDGDIQIDLENLENIDIGQLISKITAINSNGTTLWEEDFENSSFISKPMIAPDNTVITAAITIPNLPKISDNDMNGLDLAGFSAKIFAFDSGNGNIRWTFNPASLDEESHLSLFAPPVVAFNESKIYAVATARNSEEDLQELATGIIESIEQTAIESVLEAILQIVALLSEGEDTDALIDDLENDIASLINDPLKTALNETFGHSELFALDTAGDILWQTSVPGISLFSPLASDSGFVNVCTLKVLVEDVSSSVILDIALSPENLLTIDADVDLLISGEPIAFGLDFSIDASMLGNVSDITELLETEIERPKVSDLINILSRNLITEYFAYNTADGETADGELLWSSIIEGPVITKPSLTADKQQIISTVIDASLDVDSESPGLQSITNHIYSLDANNGEMKWKSDPINGSIIPPILTDNDNCVYYSFIEGEKLDFGQSDVQIGALDSNGLAKWANPFRPDDAIAFAPVITMDALYVPVNKISDIIPTDDDMDSGDRGRLRNLRPDIKSAFININIETGSAIKRVTLNGLISAPSIFDESRNALYSTTFNFNTSVNPISIELFSRVYAIKAR